MKSRVPLIALEPIPYRLAAIAAGLILAVPPAQAFSLGEIRGESFLGMPLRASVPLQLEPGEIVDNKCVKVTPDRADGLGIHVAPPQAKVELDDNGRGRILIRTQQSVNEPILRFNLQLNCGGGFFEREYTLLLDPQERTSPAAEDTGAPAASSAAPPRKAAAPARRAERTPSRAVAKPAPAVAAAAAAAVEERPKLRLSADGRDLPANGSARAASGGFRLKLSSELSLDRLGRKLSPNEASELRNKMQAIHSDDDMAEILRLRNQIETLETQLLALRQTAIAVVGADVQGGSPAEAPITAETLPVTAGEAVAAPAPAAAVSSKATRPLSGNPLGNWADYIIWILAGAVTLGLGYMLWLYRSQHGDNLGLPELFDDHAPEPAYRPDQPISRKLVNGGSGSQRPDEGQIVVPDKDRWAIEEAQILLAQGWQEQALNLLLEQIETNPYQLDIWLMLFEVHHKAGNKSEFAELAERFHGIAKGLPVWNSIRQMGQTMDPDNPLYAM